MERASCPLAIKFLPLCLCLALSSGLYLLGASSCTGACEMIRAKVASEHRAHTASLGSSRSRRQLHACQQPTSLIASSIQLASSCLSHNQLAFNFAQAYPEAHRVTHTRAQARKTPERKFATTARARERQHNTCSRNFWLPPPVWPRDKLASGAWYAQWAACTYASIASGGGSAR